MNKSFKSAEPSLPLFFNKKARFITNVNDKCYLHAVDLEPGDNLFMDDFNFHKIKQVFKNSTKTKVLFYNQHHINPVTYSNYQIVNIKSSG